MLQINGRKVKRIYRGENKVYEDTSATYYDVLIDPDVIPSGNIVLKVDPNNSHIGYLLGAFSIRPQRHKSLGTVDTSKQVKGSLTLYMSTTSTPIGTINIQGNALSLSADPSFNSYEGTDTSWPTNFGINNYQVTIN
mgnify:CR=1 FL=1